MSTPAKPPSKPAAPSGYGRPVPHNLDAERAVLGSMMLDPSIISEVMHAVHIEDFYQVGHQVAFRKMLELHDGGKPVEITLLADELRREGRLDEAGGHLYLAGLEQFVGATSAAAEHARLVREKATLRRLMVAAETILKDASEERQTVDQLVDNAEKLVFDVSQSTQSGTFRTMEDLVLEGLNEAVALHQTKERVAGTKTGFADLDNLLGGLHSSDLVILAARPSIGKTAFALDIIRNIALEGHKSVGFFSLEMGGEQINLRLVCGEARVSGHKVRHGRMSEDEYQRFREVSSRFMQMPIFVDDTAGLSLMQLRSRARRLKALHPNLGLIAVDYLQLMAGPEKKGRESNRQQEVADISRGLKALARELRVPVLALSQLSRNIENRGTKEKSARPLLSDLRESGAIEQDADVVMFVHRERVELEKDEEGNRQNKGMPIETEIIVAKHRNGPIGKADILFLPDLARFVTRQPGPR